MCGIAGIAHWNTNSYENTVLKMCNSMVHRGPDGGLVKQLNGVCFGHRRLSVIDITTSADQPMSDVSGRYWIVFNGEIYGFQTLKKELLKMGHEFLTSSDTEVILEGFKAWGIEKLCARLTGMFAFAIWDNIERELFLARDRFGEKPLYYMKDANTFRFSSNAKTLFFDSINNKELNPNAVVAFLNHGFTLPKYPIFKNLESLEPGNCMIVDERFNIKINKYWEAKLEPKLVLSRNEWLEVIEQKLDEVVKQELVSDVKIGALLSGGVDSSLIASIAAKLRPNIDLFTVRMLGSDLDESHIAKKVVNVIGGRHHIIDAKPIDIEDFIKLQGQFSEPLGDSSALAMWMVSKAAKEHVTVTLTGDGGDEMFAGYDTIKLNSRFAGYRKIFNNSIGKEISVLLKKGLKNFSDRELPRKIITLSKFVSQSMRDAHINRSFIPLSLEYSIYGKQLLTAAKEAQYIVILNKIWDQSNVENDIDKLMTYDLKHSLLGDFLPKVDVSSMYHSLETRAPFLNHSISDLAFKMPLNVKRMGDTQKGIIKTILQRKIGFDASKQVIEGKRGFVIPIDRWLDSKWTILVDELIDSELVKQGYLSKTGVEQVLKGYSKYPYTYSRLRYSLVALNSWAKINL